MKHVKLIGIIIIIFLGILIFINREKTEIVKSNEYFYQIIKTNRFTGKITIYNCNSISGTCNEVGK